MRFARFSLFAALMAVWAISEIGLAFGQTAPVEQEIRFRIERLMESGSLWIREQPISAPQLVSKIYVRREFRTAWSSERNVTALMVAIEQSKSHGLDPDDFHRTQLLALKADAARTKDNGAARADLDILLTDALVRLGYMHLFGKVDPVSLDDKWNFNRPLFKRHPVDVLNEALDGEQVEALIEKVKLSDPLYDRLRVILARYRTIADRGGWPIVPAGPVCRYVRAVRTPLRFLERRGG